MIGIFIFLIFFLFFFFMLLFFLTCIVYMIKSNGYKQKKFKYLMQVKVGTSPSQGWSDHDFIIFFFC